MNLPRVILVALAVYVFSAIRDLDGATPSEHEVVAVAPAVIAETTGSDDSATAVGASTVQSWRAGVIALSRHKRAPLGRKAMDNTDYCNVYSCGKSHIACDNDGELAVDCPENARVVDIEPHKGRILSAHNDLRNTVAGGYIDGLQPAARMAQLVWDDELAELAKLNVLECKLHSDQCHATKRHRYSGQNTAMYSYTGRESAMRDTLIIKERIQKWTNETQFLTMDVIEAFPNDERSQSVSHLTQILNDNNNHIGCAAVRYFSERFNHFLFTCNYATTNIFGRATYKAGPPTSGCKKGASNTYTSLCHPSERYNNADRVYSNQ